MRAWKPFKVFWRDAADRLQSADIGITSGTVEEQFAKIRREWTLADYKRQDEEVKILTLGPEDGLLVVGSMQVDPFKVMQFEQQILSLPAGYLE